MNRIFISLKKILRFFLSKALLIPFPLLLVKSLEKYISLYLGKGWDSQNIDFEIDICLSLLKEKPKVFVDIGANKGLYTKCLLRKASSIECHMFEPSSFNFELIENQFISNENVKLNKLALSDFKSRGKLFSNSLGSGLASLTKRRLDHFDINMNLEEEVDIIRFDQYWKAFNKVIDFVKVDVEGYDLDVLKGFGKDIHKTKLIQFEFGGANIDTKTFFQDIWYFFLEHKFLIFRITPRGIIPINYYSERDELLIYTNYIAVNKRFI